MREFVSVALLLVCFGCTDEVAELRISQARYTEDGELIARFTQRGEDGTKVHVGGTVRVDVLEGERPVCSTSSELAAEDMKYNPDVYIQAPVECAPPPDGAEYTMRLTFTDGEQRATDTYPLDYELPEEPAEVAERPTTPPAPSDHKPPAVPPAGADRAPHWPCSITETSPDSDSVARWEFEYGGPEECSIPPEFRVVGCPIIERLHAGGDGTFDHERTFRYAADGALVEVEERNRGRVERSWELYYDDSGELTRIVDHGRRGDQTLRPERGEGTVRFGLQTFHLEDGRVTSVDLPGGSSQRWDYQGRRLRRMVTTNASGAETHTRTFDYRCR